MTRDRTKWMFAIGMLAVISMVSMAAACTDGHTPGFWGNKNGQAIFLDGDDGAASLALLCDLNLKDEQGNDFDPTSYAQFRTWLLGGNAVNMRYMLSVQLAAMSLNVENGFVTTDEYIIAPGLENAWGGWPRLAWVMEDANLALADADATRDYLELLKNAIDDANNNLNWA